MCFDQAHSGAAFSLRDGRFGADLEHAQDDAGPADVKVTHALSAPQLCSPSYVEMDNADADGPYKHQLERTTQNVDYS